VAGERTESGWAGGRASERRVGEWVGASALTHPFIFYFILLVYICSILHFNERPAATRSGSCKTRGYPDPYPVKPGPVVAGPGFSGYGYGYVKKTRGRPVQCTNGGVYPLLQLAIRWKLYQIVFS
jgi:hypothetical protein